MHCLTSGMVPWGVARAQSYAGTIAEAGLLCTLDACVLMARGRAAQCTLSSSPNAQTRSRAAAGS